MRGLEREKKKKNDEKERRKKWKKVPHIIQVRSIC